jgi:hypothetical protein
VTRTFRDGHAETWHAADAELGWWGPDGARRLVVATADPATLPAKATWYLVTNLPGPAARARQTARTRPRAWPRSCGSTGSGTGLSKATSRSKTSSAGPTSRSAPTPPSATRPWSTARSASAGTPGSTTTPRRTSLEHRGRNPAAERGGTRAAPPPAPSWPQALRAIRAWLHPLDHAAALVAGVVRQAPTPTPRPHHCKPSSTRSRQATACTSTTDLTNYR